MKSLTILTVSCILASVAAADWVTDFSTFDAPAYILESNAPDCAVWEPIEQCFRLTCNTNSRYGLIIQRAEEATDNHEIQNCFTEFSAEFDFRIVGSADGIVFAWSSEPTAGRGDGGDLYWCDGQGYGVEIDCFRNSHHGDPSGTHIALLHDGIGNHLAYANVPSIEDGNWHTVGVYKTGDSVSVHYDGVELFDYVLMGNPVTNGQFRFSASTGAVSAAQDLDNIHISCQGQSVSVQTITWSGIKLLFN